MIDGPLTTGDTIGSIPVKHLKRLWHKTMLKRAGKLPQDAFEDEWQMDKAALAALGLGLEQTFIYLFQQAPSFEQFEEWFFVTGCGPNKNAIEALKKNLYPARSRLQVPILQTVQMT